ncbi:MAG: DNA recombination protein RmuC [Vicinamibacterales bacterium]
MTEILLAIDVALLVILVVLVSVALLRRPRVDLSALEARLRAIEDAEERAGRALRDEMARSRAESAATGAALRQEVLATVARMGELLGTAVSSVSEVQKDGLESFGRQLHALTESNERKLEAVRTAVEDRLRSLQEDNAARLEQVRVTVDERLQGTLEARLSESFRAVSERLEQVHRGLGEMQALASGVGDLKRVLTNVKTRGTWGEVQLGALLEQVLTPDQYESNVATCEGSGERVEFAIRLPGRDGSDRPVWLPIDAKFPLEDYQRLLEAADRGDGEGVEQASRQLEARVRSFARDIRTKYLDPPHTTDFAILYLPTEGLYAEVLRRPGLTDALQRDARVVAAGPTTIWAILNSLQMGFRTLAIEKRSSEVWAVLGAVKTHFGRFGELLSGVQKKLQEATNKMDGVARQSRSIERKLREVQELPPACAAGILSLESPAIPDALDADEDDRQPT